MSVPIVSTWADIERRALECPVLQQMTTAIRQGCPKDAAMYATLLSLSRVREDSIQRDVARLSGVDPISLEVAALRAEIARLKCLLPAQHSEA